MKKVISFLIILCGIGLLNCFADDYEYPDIAEKHIGTYVPVQLDIQFRRTKDYYKALATGYPDHHDVLFIGKNKCYSDAGFHDGYAIKTTDFKNFRFFENENGKFVMDQDGNGYKQISNHSGHGYEDFETYVLEILFDFAKDMKDISIKGNKVIIDDIEYSVGLEYTFFSTENVGLWLFSEKNGWCALVRDGYNAKLCKSKRGEYHSLYPDETVIMKEISLFFLDKNNLWNNKLYIMPKNQLRYFRNYVYALHGYKFKNAELQTYFENFTWYTPNQNFNETQFENWEKNLIKSIQTSEEKE